MRQQLPIPDSQPTDTLQARAETVSALSRSSQTGGKERSYASVLSIVRRLCARPSFQLAWAHFAVLRAVENMLPLGPHLSFQLPRLLPSPFSVCSTNLLRTSMSRRQSERTEQSEDAISSSPTTPRPGFRRKRRDSGAASGGVCGIHAKHTVQMLSGSMDE